MLMIMATKISQLRITPLILFHLFAIISMEKLSKANSNSTVHPEMDLNTVQVIRLYNYTAQEHTVITKDGYFITIQRIPYGIKRNKLQKPHHPVLLMHGLDCTSVSWVDNTPNSSLAFILADKGYDVWLGNIRGNPYARQHLNYSVDSSDFWMFSWNQNGIFDLPAMIDYILNKTGYRELYYIGHSMGTTMMFALLSSMPEYNEKIKAFMALAPVAYVSHILPNFNFVLDNFSFIQGVLKFFNQYELTPSPAMHSFFINLFCHNGDGPRLCQDFLFTFAGRDISLLDKSRIPLHVSHCSYGTSLNTLLHYMQIRKSDRFAKFDYGKDNKHHYGINEPPLYNLSKVSAPVALFWAPNDPLADAVDVAKLRKALPNVVLDYEIEYKNFTHADFLWAKTAKKLVYDKMITTMGILK